MISSVKRKRSKSARVKRKSIKSKENDQDIENLQDPIDEIKLSEKKAFSKKKSLKKPRRANSVRTNKEDKKILINKEEEEESSDEDDLKKVQKVTKKQKPLLKRSNKNKKLKKKENTIKKEPVKKESENSDSDDDSDDLSQSDFNNQKSIISNHNEKKSIQSNLDDQNPAQLDLDDQYSTNSDIDSSSDDSFLSESSNEKKFVFPKIQEIKYDKNGINNETEKVFYAFFVAHKQTFYLIAYYLAINLEDKDMSPIPEYGVGQEIEINIQNLIESLPIYYILKQSANDEYETFSFQSENYEEIINNYMYFMKKIIGEFVYSDKIYETEIEYALETDLKENGMIPRNVIIKLNDKNKIKREVSIKMNLENSLNIEREICLTYYLVWLIDEEKTFVDDEDDGLLCFKDGSCEKVDDVKSNHPLYACFSIKVV